LRLYRNPDEGRAAAGLDTQHRGQARNARHSARPRPFHRCAIDDVGPAGAIVRAAPLARERECARLV
jgi:hypothetical protein